MIYSNYMVDEVAKELYDITHLVELTYTGDEKMLEFIDQWHRLLDDQEDEGPSDKQKERMFYKKIKDSVVLKGYLDYYRRLDESHADHSYAYLLASYEGYIKKTKKDRNLDGLTKKGRKDDQRRATPAGAAEQCSYHTHGGCNYPDTCTHGRHDPEFKHSLKG